MLKMEPSNLPSFLNTTINNTEQIYHGETIGFSVGVSAFVLIVSLLGVCGNGFVIYVYLMSTTPLDSSKKAVVNLALTDMLTMACLSYIIILLFLDITMSYYVCILTVDMLFYLFSVTQFVLGITTFDRYMAICHQKKYTKFITKRKINILLVFTWVLPAPLAILPLFGFNYYNEIQTCYFRRLFHEWIFITQSVFFIVIITVTVLLYIPILLKAREFHVKTYPAQFHGVNASTTRIKAKRRAIRNSFFIGFLTFVFMVCNLPYSILRFQFGRGYSGGEAAANVTFFLGIMNSVVNPFLYAWQRQEFRQEVKKLFRCRCSDTNITNDQSMSKGEKLRRKQVILPQRQGNTSGNSISQDVLNRTSFENNPTDVVLTSTSGHPIPHNVLDNTSLDNFSADFALPSTSGYQSTRNVLDCTSNVLESPSRENNYTNIVFDNTSVKKSPPDNVSDNTSIESNPEILDLKITHDELNYAENDVETHYV